MSFFRSLMFKLGFGMPEFPRDPYHIFLLDDDVRRHDWFKQRFAKDHIDIAETVSEALELLKSASYDALFLDHDLLPEHYHAEEHDDEHTGYAIAAWLAENPGYQASSTITVHTRNADGAMRMVNCLRHSGRHADYVPFPLLTQKANIMAHR